jgi:hypothetical protein
MAFLRKLIARGFDLREPPMCPVNCIVPEGTGGYARTDLESFCRDLPPARGEVIGLVFPTYVSRSRLDDNLSAIARLTEQVKSLLESRPGLTIYFFVGMQWGQGEREESEERLRGIGDFVRSQCSVHYVGLSLPYTKKIFTLNAAFAVSTAAKARGVAWVDDDVRLTPDSLRNLVRRFDERGARGSVGARKVPQARRFLASRILHRSKLVMKTPATAYPHGCCMMIDAALAARGVPRQFMCDDDYFCFALLKPEQANPLADMEVVDDAVCSHTVGGPAREIYSRIRRSLFTSHVFQSSFPPPVSNYYFSRMQFNGLWPLAPIDLSRGLPRAALKWLLKSVYFVWYAQVGAELIVRGALRHPLKQIAWSAYKQYEVPAAGEGGEQLACGPTLITEPHGGAYE